MGVSFFRHLFENPIRAFALVCVAATSGFLAYINLVLIDILRSPEWCAKAVQAERITPGNSFQGLTGCIDIMKLQIGSLAKVLLINSGTFALCLGVLVVIVVAGARLAGKLFGNEIDIDQIGQPRGATPREEGAKTVAAAAVDEAKKVAATEHGAQLAPGEDG